MINTSPKKRLVTARRVIFTDTLNLPLYINTGFILYFRGKFIQGRKFFRPYLQNGLSNILQNRLRCAPLAEKLVQIFIGKRRLPVLWQFKPYGSNHQMFPVRFFEKAIAVTKLTFFTF